MLLWIRGVEGKKECLGIESRMIIRRCRISSPLASESGDTLGVEEMGGGGGGTSGKSGRQGGIEFAKEGREGGGMG